MKTNMKGAVEKQHGGRGFGSRAGSLLTAALMLGSSAAKPEDPGALVEKLKSGVSSLLASGPVTSGSLPGSRLRGITDLSTTEWNKCKTKKGFGTDSKKCTFPFNYKGETYNYCTQADASYKWCATGTDSDGEMIDGEYGECADCCARAHGSPEGTCTWAPNAAVPAPAPAKPIGYVGDIHPNNCVDENCKRESTYAGWVKFIGCGGLGSDPVTTGGKTFPTEQDVADYRCKSHGKGASETGHDCWVKGTYSKTEGTVEGNCGKFNEAINENDPIEGFAVGDKIRFGSDYLDWMKPHCTCPANGDCTATGTGTYHGCSQKKGDLDADGKYTGYTEIPITKPPSSGTLKCTLGSPLNANGLNEITDATVVDPHGGAGKTCELVKA